MGYIDSEKCTGCGACASICPQRAISIVNDVAVISQTRCTQCGDCVASCPADAIHAVVPVYTQSRKGGDIMRGGAWFGRGFGMGRGMGAGLGYRGWGRGNPYPYCRFHPWRYLEGGGLIARLPIYQEHLSTTRPI